MRCSRRWSEVQRALDSNERKNIGFSGARSVHGFVAMMFVADTNEPYERVTFGKCGFPVVRFVRS